MKGPTRETRERMDQIVEVLRATGPLNGLAIRIRAKMSKIQFSRAARALRDEGTVIMTGEKRGAMWALTKRSAKTNGHTVRNDRPAKTNGQVGSAVEELRQVIVRKQEDLDNLNRALVVLEASL